MGNDDNYRTTISGPTRGHTLLKSKDHVQGFEKFADIVRISVVKLRQMVVMGNYARVCMGS